MCCFRTDPRLAQCTPECLSAVERAAEYASMYGEKTLDTMNMITGMLDLRTGMAADVLKSFSITTDVMERLYDRRYLYRRCHTSSGIETIEFSRDMNLALTRATELAEDFESPFVDAAFLLLALAEQESTLGMRCLKVDPERIREYLFNCIAEEYLSLIESN